MADLMTFPNKWEQFLHDYEFEDAERIYTNGARLIPSFRVEQMIEHYFTAADVRPVVRGEWEPTDIPHRPFPKWFRCSSCKTIFGDGITGAVAPEYGNRTLEL